MWTHTVAIPARTRLHSAHGTLEWTSLDEYIRTPHYSVGTSSCSTKSVISHTSSKCILGSLHLQDCCSTRPLLDCHAAKRTIDQRRQPCSPCQAPQSIEKRRLRQPRCCGVCGPSSLSHQYWSVKSCWLATLVGTYTQQPQRATQCRQYLFVLLAQITRPHLGCPDCYPVPTITETC